MDARHVYVRAWALGCFYSLNYQYPNLSEGASRFGGQLRGDKACRFSGVTKSGRVWRRVPETDARSVGPTLNNNVDLRGQKVSTPPPPPKKKKKKKLKLYDHRNRKVY